MRGVLQKQGGEERERERERGGGERVRVEFEFETVERFHLAN